MEHTFFFGLLRRYIFHLQSIYEYFISEIL
jgi:hypothetical protein